MQKYGMTKIFPIDYSESVEIFKKYGDILKRNQCYMNVWKLFNKTHMFDGWNVSICFGYGIVTAYDSTVCVEHAFLMTKGNEILANRNKWLKPHIPSNNLYDVLRLKTVEECHANLPSKMILARYFYAITKMCVSSITG